MYCFDTSVLVDVIRGDSSLKEKVLFFDSSDSSLTTLTLCELYKGAFFSQKHESEFSTIQSFVASFDVLSLDHASCQEFGKLYALVRKKGRLVPEVDLMIAAIAKVYGLTLVTRDKKHFQRLGVQVEVW